MDTLFINGSPNKNGATVRIAETLLAGKPHGTLHLVDKRIYCYGQDFADDEFPAVLDEIRAARTLVIGSPVYWHNLSGSTPRLSAADFRESGSPSYSRGRRRRNG